MKDLHTIQNTHLEEVLNNTQEVKESIIEKAKQEYDKAFENPIISVSFETGEIHVNRIKDYLNRKLDFKEE